MPLQISEWDYGTAIKYIAKMVGHAQQVPDPAGSLDPAIQQMGVAVNHANGELLDIKEWQDLTKRGTIPIVGDFAGQTEKGFTLPADFQRFIDQTQWGQQMFLPAPGPITPQGWMIALIQPLKPAGMIYWQIRQDQLFVLAPPFPTPTNFEFFYLSKGSVIDQDDPTIYKNVASKNGDKFVLDGYLVTLMGRVKYLEWKGFDSSAAMRDFQIGFDSRAGSDKAAPVLSLSRKPQLPLISVANLPFTGYGS